MKRAVATLKYRNKLYTKFEPGTQHFYPDVRAFDMLNPGMVYQGAYLIARDDDGSALLMDLFNADASFTGQSLTHHFKYRGLLFLSFTLFTLIDFCSLFLVCLIMILHEEERNKPQNWVPFGWLPVYDEDRNKRPGQGYESTSARKIRLYHQ
jgi:hypothetical protein